MEEAKELLLEQLETLVTRSESAHDRELAGISAAMIEIYDRLTGTACKPYAIESCRCGRDRNGTFWCMCGKCKERRTIRVKGGETNA